MKGGCAGFENVSWKQEKILSNFQLLFIDDYYAFGILRSSFNFFVIVFRPYTVANFRTRLLKWFFGLFSHLSSKLTSRKDWECFPGLKSSLEMQIFWCFLDFFFVKENYYELDASFVTCINLLLKGCIYNYNLFKQRHAPIYVTIINDQIINLLTNICKKTLRWWVTIWTKKSLICFTPRQLTQYFSVSHE